MDDKKILLNNYIGKTILSVKTHGNNKTKESDLIIKFTDGTSINIRPELFGIDLIIK